MNKPMQTLNEYGIHTLVIGGAGYIGTHLIPDLLATGRRVTVLGRKATPLHELPEGVAYVPGDFGQRDLISSLLDCHQEVVHLAYATVPNTSFENPVADLLQNLPPTVQLFSEVAARGRKLVLVSSGGTVYGEAIKLPIREDHPTKPISPYGVTKLTLENYAHLYAVTDGLKFVCIRPANAFGVGQRPFVGQGFISTAMASAMRGQPIRIFGQSGTVRDYIYVSDLAAGVVSALEKGHLSETYNLGSGVGLSNMDVIEAISLLMKEIGRDVSVEHLPERAFDVKANVLDSTKLQEHTGWKPQVEFGDGLRRTCDWLRTIEKMNKNFLHTQIGDNAAPVISVVLPVYNSEKYLAEAIDSILAQTFTDFELIIIDDGSTDNSLAILQQYQQRDERIRLIARENRNLATTLNDSIDLARGEWIARMDCDDIALPQRFERQLQWLEQTGADINGSWVKFFGSWDRRIWKGYQSDQAIKMDMLFKSPFVHPSVMMRTDLIKQLRYDKSCEKAEDYDLWVRAAQAGWKMSNVPEVLLLYRKHTSQISSNSSSTQQHLGEEIQKRYWAFMTNSLGLRQESAQEVLNLVGLHVRPEMDVVDAALGMLLQHNQAEAQKAVMDNISRLYLKAAADHSDIAARWDRLNRQSTLGGAIGTKLKFWFVRLFKIRYGDNSFNFLKKMYNFVVR